MALESRLNPPEGGPEPYVGRAVLGPSPEGLQARREHPGVPEKAAKAWPLKSSSHRLTPLLGEQRAAFLG